MKATLAAKPRLLERSLSLAERVGNTPLRKIVSLSTDSVQIFAKAEWTQISGSVKARAAYQIVREAIQSGALSAGKRLLDASSGNTAIAYGAICAELDIPVTICLPRNASQRRIELLNESGVEIVFTSEFEGTEGSQEKARELVAQSPDVYYYADQYSNTANWRAHYLHTANEIYRQTNGEITHLVVGLGTTGTFTGTALRLKERSAIECIGLQPDGPMHIMEGWKHLETASVPSIYRADLTDRILSIDSEDAVRMMQLLYREEELKTSPSAAANLVGAKAVADSLDSGVVVTVLPDSIDRYKELDAEIFGA